MTGAEAAARPIRVLVANPSGDLYGSDRMVLEAVAGFAEAGWEVVVTCSRAGPLVDELRAVGADVQILAVPVMRRSMLGPRGLVQLAAEAATAIVPMRRLLRDVRPDVVLVNTVTIPLWLAVARACRVPAAAHVHEAERSGPRWARAALNAPLRLARHVIFNSEVSASVSGLRRMARRGRSTVVHNGVRGPTERQPPRAALTAPVRLVAVGRLSPRKGTDLVVDAVGRLVERGHDVELDIVGDVFSGYEWYEEQLRGQVAAADLSGRIRFRGFQREVWPFLAGADVAIVASRLDESFGNTLVEGLLAARPVVAADHTGLREAGHGFRTVRLIPGPDAAGIAAAVESLITDWPAVAPAAEADAEDAVRRFGLPRYRRAMCDVFERLHRRDMA